MEEFKAKHCQTLVMEFKPEKFPADLWLNVIDEQKSKVRDRWEKYPENRLKEVIEDVEKVAISKENA